MFLRGSDIIRHGFEKVRVCMVQQFQSRCDPLITGWVQSPLQGGLTDCKPCVASLSGRDTFSLFLLPA